MAAVPTMLGWMAQSPMLEKYDLSSLRMLTSAAAALPPAHALRLRERLPNARLFVMYGQTECKRISWLDPDALAHNPGSVGQGLAEQEHRVISEDGDAPPGQLGELVIRGPHVFKGYWRRPDLTAQKLRPATDGGLPWMHTGDAFMTDELGYLHFAGRRDEVMKIGGHKVSPAEIENLLCQLPGVLEAAVIGTPDEQWGQAAAAWLVVEADSALTPAAVKSYCSQRMRGFMVPKTIRFAKELPKTVSGKILKRDLKTLE
jgi:long-chain acyl-CoA synthetase